MFKLSDGGRTESGISEKNDCTVRAIVHVTGCEYKTAHELCAERGRKIGHGFRIQEHIAEILDVLGFERKLIARSGTLGKFIRKNPSGSFLVRVRGHAFAVVNGVVMDTWEQGERRIIRQAWVINKKQ